jgi:hypothetical protein
LSLGMALRAIAQNGNRFAFEEGRSASLS